MENSALDATGTEKASHEVDPHATKSSLFTDKAEELNTSGNNRSSSSECSLPTVRGSVPYRVWLIQGLVLLERAAFYGVSQPFPLMLSINLMDSTLIAQAGEMETHGLPNDIMYNLNPISVMVILPFIQGWLYPFLNKRKIAFTLPQRIAVGLSFAAIAIGYSAGVQQLIYSTGPGFNHPLKCLSGEIPNEVNVGVQTPTYVFLGVAEILAIVAGTELAYTKAPASMKSIVQAIFKLFCALGSVLGVGVSFAAYNPHMVIVYSSIAALLVAATMAFQFSILGGYFT